MDVSLLMPCKGRPEQTVALLPRLPATVGAVAWELICIVDDDAAVAQALTQWKAQHGASWLTVLPLNKRVGYWRALSIGSQAAQGRLLSNIANDVLPGRHWLQCAVSVFDAKFPGGLGVVGYNDGILFEDHTGHLLVGRALLEAWYGEACWPVFYDHLYGDTELCHRAMEEGIYAIALKSVLFHNHFVIGQAQDTVYRYAHQRYPQDRALFHQREANGWTH